MALITKIKLDDQHVVQQVGTTLTLSGDTKYATHPTFTEDVQIVDKRYVDEQIVFTTGNTIYNLASPASVTVGGIVVGTILTGKSSNCLLKEILVPTLNPILTAPSNSLSLSISGNFEVGSSQTFQVCSIFNRGSINPQYTSASPFRSGNAITHCMVGSCVSGNHACTALIDTETANSYIMVAGANTWNSCVYYGVGAQPKNSADIDFDVPLSAGNTTGQNATLTGIYPYFWGKVNAAGAAGVGRPTATAALITGGTKVVAVGSGTLNINFNSTDSDYIWFAVPSTYATKTVWYLTALNNGLIGGVVSAGGELFPAPDIITNVANGLWSGQSYKVYISNYQSATANSMALS